MTRKARHRPQPQPRDVLPPLELLRALRAFRSGDFSVRLPPIYTGVAGEIADELNQVIELNRALSEELLRVSKVVGKDGKIGVRASLGDLGGSWSASLHSVNALIDDLVRPTTEVGRVIGAFAAGDLSQTMTLEIDGRPLRGEFLRTAKAVNGMVEQLGSFASEVTRVAREVGTEGKLGGQAKVRGVSGTWKDLTESVNLMAGNLTGQVRNIAEVTTAVAKGDLSKKITVDVKGEILQLKNTINTMVDQLNSFASEVTRVAREVGTEGKLGGQARVKGIAGTWKDLTDSVNSMASNLTAQVRNIADVTTAVATGDLTKKITVDVKGEILELKNTINTMVDQLNSFASEVTRVAREVGTEGKLGGQARVPDVSGTWKDLTDSVNFMAGNLTAQVRNIAEVTTAVARGDLSKKITVDVRGEILLLKDTINTMVDQLNAFASEVTRVAREVGTEGKLGGQAQVPGVSGTWKDLTDSVNFMAGNLTAQVRNIAAVTTAVASGDLSKKITVDVRGEILLLKDTINTMVDQLNAFASEVTRVAREVGTEGKLGGQARVPGVAGTWKDLTDNVNSMASNLTNQVRGIATVVTAVANGDLTRELALEARGEIAELAETINSMTDTLAIFAEQVIVVAREVGVEGKLGGQAKVPGAAGTWRDLTDNVNQLAANLTTQVRAISDVATAVTKGDLNRYITVEASGEVATLKDNINEMIRNLKETTQKTTEQDWLKTNLARFTRMLQGQRDLVAVARQTLSELAPLVTAQHGVVYLTDMDEHGEARLKLLASYACADTARPVLGLGEGLIGQVALEKRKLVVNHVPPGYVIVRSGLGEAAPTSLTVLPVLFEGRVNAVIELGSFDVLSDIHQVFLDQLTESIGIVINTISASMRTEALLQQSQSLTRELQIQQEELRQTNDRLELQAATLRESEERLKQQQEALQVTNEQLEDKAELLEVKNREVELAKAEIEEKAEQLALASKYKSEFLANMSHELRTPLNSLLILSTMLAENSDGTLSDKHIEFARTIHASGTDLLALINDILDLSKIESGTIVVQPGEVAMSDLRDYVQKNFRHVAQQRGLEFQVEIGVGVPATIVTDAQRLQQVLKNLLSNAFKFTERGRVTLEMKVATTGFSSANETLAASDVVVAFSVSDTGIGIPENKQTIIFEAFQQTDGTTSRRYGGTGLGLSISREIARLLGGEIGVVSAPGAGSTFTFYLPRIYAPPPASARHERIAGSMRAPQTLPLLEASIGAAEAEDERSAGPGEPVFLVVDDDDDLTRTALEVARRRGIKALVASDSAAAVELARKTDVFSVALGLRLTDSAGWAVLDQLKHDSRTRHVPVSVFGTEEARQRAFAMGAAYFAAKPAVEAEIDHALSRMASLGSAVERRLLIAGGDEAWRERVRELLDGDGVVIELRESVAVARGVRPQCVVTQLPVEGAEELPRLLDGDSVPVVLQVDPSPTASERARLAKALEPLVVRIAGSDAALLEQTCIFLHRPERSLDPRQRLLLDAGKKLVPELDGAKVLVVDDDVRNIFAVTSVLEQHRAQVIYADNGKEGLELLAAHPDVRLVLMDIMMPQMDGYDVIRRIREQPACAGLPVIAVTAKAMRTDREKCIQAGASDYLAKPVNVENLLSTLRVWLSQ